MSRGASSTASATTAVSEPLQVVVNPGERGHPPKSPNPWYPFGGKREPYHFVALPRRITLAQLARPGLTRMRIAVHEAFSEELQQESFLGNARQLTNLIRKSELCTELRRSVRERLTSDRGDGLWFPAITCGCRRVRPTPKRGAIPCGLSGHPILALTPADQTLQ